MGTNNLVFLENIEWFDETGRELVHRIPDEGSGEIKYGAQLTVRESQVAVLFYKGKACDAFEPGRHTLHTGNIPILTKILSIPWAMSSPLRAEVYFANMKVFTDLKWGTREPVAFRDAELGLVRLRAHGVFNVRITQPVLFINTMAGTMGNYGSDAVEEYLRKVIVSRLNDHLGENLDTILNLPGRFDGLADGLAKRLEEDFSAFGLALTQLYITSITPPPEVQQAIDGKGSMELIPDMDRFVRLKAALAMEKAASSGGDAGAGIGMGLGLVLPGLLGGMYAGGDVKESPVREAGNRAVCTECGHAIPGDARFCPYCGHQQLILGRCTVCGKNLKPGDRFCPRCGHPADERPKARTCPKCGAENLPGSVFCNLCGEKIG